MSKASFYATKYNQFQRQTYVNNNVYKQTPSKHVLCKMHKNSMKCRKYDDISIMDYEEKLELCQKLGRFYRIDKFAAHFLLKYF